MSCRVLHRGKATVLTDAGDDLHGGEQAARLDARPLPVDPVRCNRIQPRTFDRQAGGPCCHEDAASGTSYCLPAMELDDSSTVGGCFRILTASTRSGIYIFTSP